MLRSLVGSEMCIRDSDNMTPISNTFLFLFGRTGGGLPPPPALPHWFRLRPYGRRISLKSQLMAKRNGQLMAERNGQLMAERNSQLMAERIYAYEKFSNLMIFGRTDLRISLSGAKFDEEADFDVRSAVGIPKPHQIDENIFFRSKYFAEKVFSASKNRKLQIF